MSTLRQGLMAAAAALAVFAAGTAQAQVAGETKIAAGVGVICNTTAQAQNYVKLRNDGAEVTLAVSKVNDIEKDPRACGVAAVAFERDKTVATVNQHGQLVSIVQVRIVAGFDGTKWARVPDTVQFAIIENDGIEV